MKINTMIRILLGSALGIILAGDTALARGRGGGMGGGMRGGMGGGMRGGMGGGMRGGMGSMGGGMGGMRGGMGYSGGMRGGMGYSGGMRGGFTPSPSFSRPNMGSGYRPQGVRPSTGISNRPNVGSGNRPNLGNSIGSGNRPNIGSGNRPNIGNDIGNRPNIGSGNRPNIGNEVGNRANINTGNRTNIAGGGNVGINNRQSNINVNRINSNRNYGNWTGAGWGAGPINRAGYRHGWVNGYWHGSRRGFATGLVTGGLIGWGWGSTPYYWGYASYSNPYYIPVPVGVAQPASSSFNYAQPINTQAPPPDDSVVDSAEQTFDNARAAFKQGNYNQAMDLINQVITQVPNDATAHEFRALVFFALKNYDQAAATLYPVLSVGPGWDWTTLVGLYPSLDVYTEQLRALEAACKANPKSAPDQFVLGYHYLTQGHTDAAAHLFQEVARLQPGDQLAAQLGREFSKDDQTQPPPPAPVPVSTFEPKPDSLFGTWKASPSNDVSIELTLPSEGDFVWKVVQNGTPQTITGEFSASDDLLTLAQANNGPVMVGKLTWQDANHFQFRLVNTDPNDPGLAFSK